MITDKTYNGWTNYETWNIKLWIDNDEGSNCFWGDIADETLEEHNGDVDAAARQLSRQLKDTFDESMPDLGATCWADLLNAALGEVNWYEIAESLANDAKERASE